MTQEEASVDHEVGATVPGLRNANRPDLHLSFLSRLPDYLYGGFILQRQESLLKAFPIQRISHIFCVQDLLNRIQEMLPIMMALAFLLWLSAVGQFPD